MSRHVKQFGGAVLGAVEQRMFGVDEVIRLCLVALYTNGHVLLEGNPGLGKTELVKSLGRVLQLPFGRIQFTPDLMPADITGTFMPDFENQDARRLAFRPGPIFTSLLLADEINRATPKTQSAMLEAMAEGQVTVLGERYQLDSPFMVLATQNPIDHEGTYNLPEAQADRFMFKVNMPIPNGNTLRLIMGKKAGRMAGEVRRADAQTAFNSALLPKDKAASKKLHAELQQTIEQVEPLPSLERHILNMFLASNWRFDELEDLDRRQSEHLKRLVDELMTYGLGPRAAIALMLGAKAWSLMFLPQAEYAEGAALARVLIPTLRHRIKLHFDWEERYRAIIKRKDDFISLEEMLVDFCLTSAPKGRQYKRVIEKELNKVMKERGW